MNQIDGRFKRESSITLGHANKTGKTFDRATVREPGRFLEFQKTVKNTEVHLYNDSGN
jgi:hypothetical protein